uniref:Uncharacterized protein n=1 Tax=Corvus moneduloides TaxID=1196302 RepID=A0A8C3EWR0_CORMO
MAAPGSVSAAFQEYLRHLGLQDFPCGLGSWVRVWGEPAGLEETVLPGEETPEVLLELLRDQHSPWALPHDCSPQDRLLREVSVLAPELLRSSRVFQVVKSLRILDKGVSAVDEGVLRFQQLEELILSANRISKVTSAHLPRALKVLELCCNAVHDLQDLCARPPPELQHLGLGYNRLCGPSQEKHFTVDFWPNLVSLDLSFNSLTDLQGLVSQLSTLQNLRILVLQGNPLALIPSYRGFLMDSLPKLSILDDIHIQPDERQQFHGLARQPGEPLPLRNEGRVVVSIGEMKGLPNPKAFQQLKVGSEGPMITYSYRVTYEFAEREELEDRSYGVMDMAWVAAVLGTGFPCGCIQQDKTQLPMFHIPLGEPRALHMGVILEADRSLFQVTQIHQSPTVATLDVDSSAQDTGEAKKVSSELFCVPIAKVFATPGQPWADTIDFSYRKEHVAKDLMGLKSYLEAGTIVSVVEEKVRVVTPKTRPLPKSPFTCPCVLHRPVSKDKQKKKKQPCEFHSDPPIRSILGTRRVTLKTLLATENMVAAVCEFGILIPQKPPEPPASVSAQAPRVGCRLPWETHTYSTLCQGRRAKQTFG